MDLFCSASTHRTADKQFFHSILLRTALQEQALRTERSAPHTGQHQHPAQHTSHRRTDCTRQEVPLLNEICLQADVLDTDEVQLADGVLVAEQALASSCDPIDVRRPLESILMLTGT